MLEVGTAMLFYEVK